jgi:hypothetical protein
MFKKPAITDDEKEVIDRKGETLKEREDNIRQMVTDKNTNRKDMFVVDVPKSWEALKRYKNIPITFYQVKIYLKIANSF